MAENHKLWDGRFEASLEKWVEFGASISFDQKMAEFDLKGLLPMSLCLVRPWELLPKRALQIKQGLEELGNIRLVN